MILKNKTVLITGASNGIGYEISKILVSLGCNVICFDISIPKVPIYPVEYCKVDVTSEKEIAKTLSKIKKNSKRRKFKIDILVNNAGIMRRGNLFDSSEKDFDDLLRINLKAYWLMIKLTKEYMSKRPVLVQMASRHVFFLKQNPAIYTITKSAGVTMAEILKLTCKNYDVKILCPGSTDTALSRQGVSKKDLKIKYKNTISPYDLAEKIVTLLKKDKHYLIYNEKKKKYITK